jgi:hypothetical protein
MGVVAMADVPFFESLQRALIFDKALRWQHDETLSTGGKDEKSVMDGQRERL